MVFISLITVLGGGFQSQRLLVLCVFFNWEVHLQDKHRQIAAIKASGSCQLPFAADEARRQEQSVTGEE